MEHALEAHPKEPHHGGVLPVAAELLSSDCIDDLLDALLGVALADVDHFKGNGHLQGNAAEKGCELLDPVDVLASIQAYESVISYLLLICKFNY